MYALAFQEFSIRKCLKQLSWARNANGTFLCFGSFIHLSIHVGEEWIYVYKTWACMRNPRWVRAISFTSEVNKLLADLLFQACSKQVGAGSKQSSKWFPVHRYLTDFDIFKSSYRFKTKKINDFNNIWMHLGFWISTFKLLWIWKRVL